MDISAFITRNAIDGFALRYANSRTDFIAEEVFTPVIISKTATKKYQHDLSNLRPVIDESDSKAQANKVDYNVFSSNVTTLLHKLSGDIDPHDERNADAPVANIKQTMAAVIMEKLLIRREMLAVSAITTVASYHANNTSALGATATWAVTGGDPIADSITARSAVKATAGVPANSVAMGWQGYQTLLNNPLIVDRLKYTSGATATLDAVKNLLQVENIYVSRAVYNNATQAAANAVADIWDDSALFFYKGTGPNAMSYGHWYVRNNLYTHEYVDNTKGSGDGRITTLEMGWEYALAAGAVMSSSDGDFAGGYLLRNIY